jgi:hypothetical protein
MKTQTGFLPNAEKITLTRTEIDAMGKDSDVHYGQRIFRLMQRLRDVYPYPNVCSIFLETR